MGMVMYAGVDYEQILRQAETECDVVIWDGGNNDFPFFVPNLQITVVDPLRPGHELAYYPGETCLLRADVVVVNKIDSAAPADLATVVANVERVNPRARIVRQPRRSHWGRARRWQASVSLSSRTARPSPTVACPLVPALSPPITRVPRRSSTRVRTQSARIAETYARYPGIGAVLPAMGYGDEQLAELGATVRKAPCDAVVIGTPMDLARLVDLGHPSRRVSYELRETGSPTLKDILDPLARGWSESAGLA